MNKRYGNTQPIGYANTRTRSGNGFVVGGIPGRECRECFGVGGHFTYCDKTR